MTSGPGYEAWHSFNDITNKKEAPIAAGKAMILKYPAELPDIDFLKTYLRDEMLREELPLGPEFPTWDNPLGTARDGSSKTGAAIPTNRSVGNQGDGGFQKMGAFQFNSDTKSFPPSGQTGAASKTTGTSNMTAEEPVPKFENIDGVELPSKSDTRNGPPAGWVVGRNVFGQPVTISDKGLSAPIFNPTTGKALLGKPLRTMPIGVDIQGGSNSTASKPTAYALVSEGFKVENQRAPGFQEQNDKPQYNPGGFETTDVRHPAFPGHLFKCPPWLVPQKPVEREDGGFHIGVFDHPASGVFGATPDWTRAQIPCGPDGGVPWPNCPRPPPPSTKSGPQAGDPDYKYRDGIVFDVSTGMTRFEQDDESKARRAAKRAAMGLPPVAEPRPWWDTDAHRMMEADAARDAGVPEALNMLRAMGLEDTARKFHHPLVFSSHANKPVGAATRGDSVANPRDEGVRLGEEAASAADSSLIDEDLFFAPSSSGQDDWEEETLGWDPAVSFKPAKKTGKA
jgi:hypothetical protein